MVVSFNTLKNRQINLSGQSRTVSSGLEGKSFFEESLTALAENKQAAQSRSEWMDAWIEKNKNNDFGVLMGGGVTADKPMNWDADGSSQLTEEQIDYLRSTYDLSDMSKQDYYDLMADLTNMNVISIEDVVSQYVKPIIPGETFRMSVSIEDLDRGFGHMNKSGNLWENLQQYRKDLDYVEEWLKHGYSGMSSSAFLAFKDYLSSEKDVTGILESVFSLIA